MTRTFALGVIAASVSITAISAQQSTPGASAPIQVPKTTAASPSGCAREVADFIGVKQKELQAGLPPALPLIQPGQQRTPAEVAQATARSSQLAAINQQIVPARLAMMKDCAERFASTTFDVKVGNAPAEEIALAQIYADAGMMDRVPATVAAALAVPGQTPETRAATLSSAITTTLREPKGDERNARLEKMSDALDALPDTFLDQKFAAHFALNSYYRYDDLDGGIIKHSTWIIDHITTAPADLRKKYAARAVGAYVNKGEALAGQGMNDEAIAIMNRACVELPEVNPEASVKSEIERLQLVGTPAAALKAPRWLNMPAGKTTLDMTGQVTLLEFSAHWCVPCKESYPGVNRLLAKYGPKGFRVALATQMYGYFETERPLTAEVEFERDRKYFAEHGMNVPIAIGDKVDVKFENGVVQYLPAPEPNSTAYKVGGIPQIHLIDKHGKIRLVMVGYDDANEAKIAKMIEDLLKEK